MKHVFKETQLKKFYTALCSMTNWEQLGLKFEGARTDNCNTCHAKENLKGRYLKMKQVKWMC
ncbi:hypothetical protein C5167_015233 [Papaver somniferum]|uniref:Uncharacterized protein n=1 Tax=Papaver somniferum TaxID=3469 RepID=A0A4Y7J8K6_PAPSO|nr:hypothetical protein C5167_015233 [Papaver somniferum]